MNISGSVTKAKIDNILEVLHAPFMLLVKYEHELRVQAKDFSSRARGLAKKPRASSRAQPMKSMKAMKASDAMKAMKASDAMKTMKASGAFKAMNAMKVKE